MNGGAAGDPMKQPLADAPRLLARMPVFLDSIKSFFDFSEPEFKRLSFPFSANPQLQNIARFLFPQPAIGPARHFPAIPDEDIIPHPQVCELRRAIGNNALHYH